MRCFFMRDGHIAAVELLEPVSDQEAVHRSKQLFLARVKEGFDGFEVWDHQRIIFRYPEM
jgi:hypothetical protein